MSTSLDTANRAAEFARSVIRADAAFCGIGGLLFAVGSQPLSRFLGLSTPISLIALGVLLVPYAGLLFISASRPTIDRDALVTPAIGNALWVVASAAIILTGWPGLTNGGNVLVAVVATIVLALGGLELVALRRIS